MIYLNIQQILTNVWLIETALKQLENLNSSKSLKIESSI